MNDDSLIIGNKIKLRDKRLVDAANDYSWQSDPELAQLDAAPPLIVNFPEYMSDYSVELQYTHPSRRRFAAETLNGKHIGNCGYYGIDEKKGEAELGIMIGNRKYWNKGYGADIVSTLVDYIFRHTNLKRIHLKTLDSNIRAQKCFKKCGFNPYGHSVRNGFSFMLMELNRKQWEEQQREA
jgi:RimJ/RimL family protein N-acetyltransferase